MKTVKTKQGWHTTPDEFFAKVEGFTYTTEDNINGVIDVDGRLKSIESVLVIRREGKLMEILKLEDGVKVLGRMRKL
jgi:hypothetical protein